MKHLTFILAIFIHMFITACGHEIKNIPPMEYGDCEPNEMIDYPFFVTAVESIFLSLDNHYYIEYSDYDGFDLGYIAEMHGKEKGEDDYLIIEVNENDIHELIEDANKDIDEQFKINLDEKWLIKEVKTPEGDYYNFKYYLIKNPEYE